MDEEITIIDSNTRNEKIRNFFINNKKNLIIGFLIILALIIGYLSIKEVNDRKKIKLANQFNITKINYTTENKQATIDQLTKLVNESEEQVFNEMWSLTERFQKKYHKKSAIKKNVFFWKKRYRNC